MVSRLLLKQFFDIISAKTKMSAPPIITEKSINIRGSNTVKRMSRIILRAQLWTDDGTLMKRQKMPPM